MSHVTQHSTDSARYAKCVEVSKRIRWDTDRDVIRGRQFDFGKTFLPDGLSKVAQLPVPQRRREAPVLAGAGPHLRQHVRAGRALHRRQGAGDQPRPLARRPGRARSAGAPDRRGTQAPGDVPPAGDDDGARHARRLPLPAAAQRRGAGGAGRIDLGRAGAGVRHRAVLAGALPQQHRRPRRRSTRCGRTCSCSTGRRSRSTPSSTRWSGCARTSGSTRRSATRRSSELIGLVGAVDGIVQMQAKADADYFAASRRPRVRRRSRSRRSTRRCSRAYRWQYIVSGVQDPRFLELLGSMINAEQGARINAALAPIVGAVH